MRVCLLYCRKKSFTYSDVSTDGIYCLLGELRHRNIADRVRLVLQDGREQHSQLTDPDTRVELHLNDNLDSVKLEPGEVLWVRGGWHSWIPWIEARKREGTRVLFYAANTGHERWPYWDVVLDDFVGGAYVDKLGRARVPYIKPTWMGFAYNPTITMEPFDVCLGASYIYDKKQQWRALEICREFERKYGHLKKIMPGKTMAAGIKTEKMFHDIVAHRDVAMPGFVPRAVMANIYNQSRVLIHAQSAGQGDRCVTESMMCGCRVLDLHPERSSTFLYANQYVRVPKDYHDVAECAELLHELLMMPVQRRDVAAYFNRVAGMPSSVYTVKKALEALAHGPFTSTTALQEWTGPYAF